MSSASAAGRPPLYQRLAGLLLAVASAGLASASWAQATGGAQVYRCAAGQYSQTPCPDGQALVVDPTPDHEKQREARAMAARDQKLADQLRTQRLAAAQAAARQPPVRIGPPAAAASAPQPSKNKKAKAKRRAPAASAAQDSGGAKPEPKSRRAYGPQTTP